MQIAGGDKHMSEIYTAPVPRMHLIVLFAIVLFKGKEVAGADLNSLLPRLNCYPGDQKGCNQTFVEAYPELSKSSTGLADAYTWFLLFTKQNPDNPEKLHQCAGRLLPNSNYNSSNRLILILMPFIVSFCDVAVYREMKVQFLLRPEEDLNVMVVDFGWGNRIDYGASVDNTLIVAKQTVQVLKNIREDKELDSSKIYCVGHSLGAQICGLIGYLYDEPIGRITGLDPAGPGFPIDKPLEERLDPSDADKVDVWHVNMGDCLPKMGINYDAGHVDFYINGGMKQECCQRHAAETLARGDFIYGIGALVLPETCYHAIGAVYYKVSINPGNCQFVGVKCGSTIECQKHIPLPLLKENCGSEGENCMIMGFDWDKHYNTSSSVYQRYYVKTSVFMECPYCITNCTINLQGYTETYKSSLQS